MPLRTLIDRLTTGRRTFPVPPPGTTHVVQHMPSFLRDSPEPGDADGWWELQPLAAWRSGELLDNQPWIAGPADMDGEVNPVAFAEDTLGYLVSCVGFEVEISHDGCSSAEPAYYVAPLGEF